MSSHDERRDALLQAWLDGELSADESAAFEARRRADPELDAHARLAWRLEGRLRARFRSPVQPPLGVRGVLAAVRAPELRPAAAPPAAGAVSARPWLLPGVVLAAAGFGALVLRSPALQPRLLEDPARGPVPPAVTAALDPDEARRLQPDLTDVFCNAQQQVARRASARCEPASDEPVEAGDGLLAHHAEAIGLWPDAATELEGPILSAQWPGSLIFAERAPAGRGAGADGEPRALLIAERDSTITCCLDLELPRDSELNLFSWRVGELLWFELSPDAEPRLLPRLSAVTP